MLTPRLLHPLDSHPPRASQPPLQPPAGDADVLPHVQEKRFTRYMRTTFIDQAKPINPLAAGAPVGKKVASIGVIAFVALLTAGCMAYGPMALVSDDAPSRFPLARRHHPLTLTTLSLPLTPAATLTLSRLSCSAPRLTPASTHACLHSRDPASCCLLSLPLLRWFLTIATALAAPTPLLSGSPSTTRWTSSSTLLLARNLAATTTRLQLSQC